MQKLVAGVRQFRHDTFIEENYGNVTDPAARLMVTVQENVLVQLENLRTHPAVAAATNRNELDLHGWVYEFETGQVFSHHADKRQFAPIDGASLGD